MTYYFIGQLEERNGEYEYQIPVRFTAASISDAAMTLEEAARAWYGNSAQEDSGCYYFHGSEVCVRSSGYKEIPESIYTALNGFVAEAT